MHIAVGNRISAPLALLFIWLIAASSGPRVQQIHIGQRVLENGHMVHRISKISFIPMCAEAARLVQKKGCNRFPGDSRTPFQNYRRILI
jgi:hypothetical protein